MEIEPDQQADDVRQRMAQLRRVLDGDIVQVSESARAMTDWRYYVRRYPWAATAAAAAAGYLLMPRRGESLSREVASLAETLTQQTSATTASEPVFKLRSMAGSLLALVGAAAVRAATNYVTDKVTQAARGATEVDGEEEPTISRPR